MNISLSSLFKKKSDPAAPSAGAAKKMQSLESIQEHVELHCHPKTSTERITEIDRELIAGFELLKKHENSVTIYGSARFKEGDVNYEKARGLGKRIVSELGWAVITGGGPGMMEAGNRGAKEAGGNSLGLPIDLPNEQVRNQYLTESANFYYFFIRKLMLSFSSRAYVFFPGGFGTLDEFFETVTLVQTGKIKDVPVILMGTDFWAPLLAFIKAQLADSYKTIDPQDTSIYHLVDTEDQALELIRKAPAR